MGENERTYQDEGTDSTKYWVCLWQGREEKAKWRSKADHTEVIGWVRESKLNFIGYREILWDFKQSSDMIYLIQFYFCFKKVFQNSV